MRINYVSVDRSLYDVACGSFGLGDGDLGVLGITSPPSRPVEMGAA